MHRKPVLILVIVSITLFCAGPASGILGDWAPLCKKAELIIVGTLVNVERDAHYDTRYAYGSEIRSYYDVGRVKIQEVLKGQAKVDTLEITWFHRIDYPTDKMWIEDSQGYELSKDTVGVWLLLPTRKWDLPKATFLEMKNLGRVRTILRENDKNAQ